MLRRLAPGALVLLALGAEPQTARAQIVEVFNTTMTVGSSDLLTGYDSDGTLGSVVSGTFTYGGADFSLDYLYFSQNILWIEFDLSSDSAPTWAAAYTLCLDGVARAAWSGNFTGSKLVFGDQAAVAWAADQSVTVTLVEGSTCPTAAANSVATGAPTISGAAKVKETLTAETDGIADADGLTGAVWKYQWIRVDGSTSSDITGSTSLTYTPTRDDDLGKKLKVKVSFTDDGGNDEELESEETASVIAAAPTLKASAVTRLAATLTIFDHTAAWWYRKTLPAPAGTCTPVMAGAAAVSLAGLTADTSYAYKAYSDSTCATELASEEFTTLGGPTLSVTAITQNTATLTVAFHPATWYHQRTAPSAGTCSGAQTGASADVAGLTAGASYTWKTYSDSGCTNELASRMFQTTTAANNPATGAPTISGTPQAGQTLTAATAAVADADGLTGAVWEYRWIRVDGMTEADISGATDSTYVPVAADVGKKLKVRASFTDDGGSPEERTSAETGPVTAAPNTPATGAPTIGGAAQVGETLYAFTGEIEDANGLTGVTWEYQWIRVDGNTETDIPGANARTYVPVAADVGKKLKVRVSFTDAGGNDEELVSLVAAAVTAPPEIEVSGNGQNIMDGDSSPETADHTEFGSVSVSGGTKDRTFTISNTGLGSLQLPGSPQVRLSGTDAGDFSVVAPLEVTTVAAGGSTAFTVRFDPSETGPRTARVEIATNDADESSFDFIVRGTGTPNRGGGGAGGSTGRAPAASNRTVATREDTPYVFRARDFADEARNDVVAITIVTLPGRGALTLRGTAVRPGAEVTASALDAGDLVWTPPADTNGDSLTSFTFRVGNGGEASGDTYRMTLDVTAVNDPPQAADSTAEAREDTPYAFRARDFRFTDPDRGDALTAVSIETLPAQGSLALRGVAVRRDALVAASALEAGALVWTPPEDAHGDALTSFFFRVRDGARTPSADAYRMTINVAPVNDPPRGADNTVTANEDAPYVFRARDFPFTDLDGGDAFGGVVIVTPPERGALSLGGVAVATRPGLAASSLPGAAARRGAVVTASAVAAGALVWTPPENAHGAALASFTFRVRDSARAESVDTYTMTLDVRAVRDVMPTGWLARFGRTVASQVTEAVGARTAGGRRKRVQVGGAVIEGTAGEAGGLSLSRAGAGEALRDRDLLLGSSFEWSGQDAADEGPAWAVWGRFALDAFESDKDRVRMDGEVMTALAGVDVGGERWLAGLAASGSEGDGGYELVGGNEAEDVDTRLAGVYPYARLRLAEWLDVWGLGGYGIGEAAVTGDAGAESEVEMRMGAAGTRGRLPGRIGGVEAAVRADALWVRMRTGDGRDADGAVRFEGGDAQVQRLRLLLELTRGFGVAGGILTPAVTAGARYDEGDAETGAGMEVGGRLRYARRNFAVEGSARGLVTHEESGFREWGAAGTLQVGPGSSGRGFSLTVAPALGAAASGAERLWSARDPGALARDGAFEAASRLETGFGYGLRGPRGVGLLRPYTRLSLSGGGGRQWRLGSRWTVTPVVAFGVEASRGGGGAARPGPRLTVHGRLRW